MNFIVIIDQILPILSFILAVAGMILSVAYFFVFKGIFRYIKLMYAFNMAIMTVVYAHVVFDVDPSRYFVRLGIFLLLCNIVAGLIVSFSRKFSEKEM